MSRAASLTAIAVALQRAVHASGADGALILSDAISGALLGDEPRGSSVAAALLADSAGARALRAHCVLRAAFAQERALAAIVERGVRQVLILGAGLDTLTYRQPAAMASARSGSKPSMSDDAAESSAASDDAGDGSRRADSRCRSDASR